MTNHAPSFPGRPGGQATDEVPDETTPDFGPGGYLPERAAHRARKIVLRQRMGLQWPIAAAIAALVVLMLGVTYLVTQTGPPRAPFVAAGQLAAIDARGSAILDVEGRSVLVVRGAGGVGAFDAPDVETRYCRPSRRIEAADGRVWLADGRLVGGHGSSLAPLTVRVHDGILYIDPAPNTPPPAAPERGEQPVCG